MTTTRGQPLLVDSELSKARDFLCDAGMLVTEVKSLFFNTGDAATAARLKDIQGRLADEIRTVERLIAASSASEHGRTRTFGFASLCPPMDAQAYDEAKLASGYARCLKYEPGVYGGFGLFVGYITVLTFGAFTDFPVERIRKDDERRCRCRLRSSLYVLLAPEPSTSESSES